MSTKLLVQDHILIHQYIFIKEEMFAKYGPVIAMYMEGDSWIVEYQDYRDADDAYYGLTCNYALDIIKK